MKIDRFQMIRRGVVGLFLAFMLALLPTASAQAPSAATSIPTDIAAGLLRNAVPPVYPAIAKAAHVSGAVVLRVVISKTGNIEELSVVSGPAMLVSAALAAVRQWTYRPFLLNGVATSVETTVTVNFSLSEMPAAPSSTAAEGTALRAQAQTRVAVPVTTTSGSTMEDTVAYINSVFAREGTLTTTSPTRSGRQQSFITDSQRVSIEGNCKLSYKHRLRTNRTAPSNEEQIILLNMADPRAISSWRTGSTAWTWGVALGPDKNQPPSVEDGKPSEFDDVGSDLGDTADRSAAENLARAYIHAIILCHAPQDGLEGQSVQVMLARTAALERGTAANERRAIESATEETAPAPESRALTFLNALNGALGQVSDQLATENAEQEQRNAEQQQQAEDLVDRNNARRAQEAEQRRQQSSSTGNTSGSTSTEGNYCQGHHPVVNGCRGAINDATAKANYCYCP